MNFVYGKVIEVFEENEMRTARVRVAAAVRKVSIDLIADAQEGDEVLICDGVVIGKANDVSGHSR